MIEHSLQERHIGFETGPKGIRTGLPTLVMVHGAGGRAAVWSNQLRALEDLVNPLALDLPGHGESAGPGMASIEAYAAWLGGLLSDLFTESVFLMGHSMGGAVAQRLAADLPDRLRGLILVGTGPRLMVAPAFLEGLQGAFETTVDQLIGYAYAPDADPLLISQGATLMKAPGQKTVCDDFAACNAFAMGTDTARIRTPCLILCGEKDRLTPPSLSEKLLAAIQGSRFAKIPDGGHMVMIENPKGLNGCVRDFLLGQGV